MHIVNVANASTIHVVAQERERRQGELAKSLALYLKFLNIPEQLKTRLSIRGNARRIKWKATRQVDTDSNAGQQGGKIGQDYHIS